MLRRPTTRIETRASDVMTAIYLHHTIQASPLQWQSLSDALVGDRDRFAANGGTLFGVWRSQIGRPRDELNVITVWRDEHVGQEATAKWFERASNVFAVKTVSMQPTLRPNDPTPPVRQGNYAWRYSTTTHEDWPAFLDLCVKAWPGFESSYDSQIIGLWQLNHAPGESTDHVRSLLLTRRPDLAMWERSKLPQGEAEAEVRRTLSARYDLCTDTVVYTSTLLSAADHKDRARWT